MEFGRKLIPYSFSKIGQDEDSRDNNEDIDTREIICNKQKKQIIRELFPERDANTTVISDITDEYDNSDDDIIEPVSCDLDDDIEWIDSSSFGSVSTNNVESRLELPSLDSHGDLSQSLYDEVVTELVRTNTFPRKTNFSEALRLQEPAAHNGRNEGSSATLSHVGGDTSAFEHFTPISSSHRYTLHWKVVSIFLGRSSSLTALIKGGGKKHSFAAFAKLSPNCVITFYNSYCVNKLRYFQLGPIV